MSEDDNEVLDWGNEDDVVSLGDDEPYTFGDPAPGFSGTASVENAPNTPSRATTPPPDDSRPKSPDGRTAESNSQPKESKKPSSTLPALSILPRPTHALPPKPVAANVPYVPPSHPSIVEATAMSSRPKKANNSGHTKSTPSFDDSEPLPPDWEIRHPRSGTGVYYYNTVTFQSQWTIPSSRPSRSTADADVPKSSLNVKNISLTHDDRHYRPADSARYIPSTGTRYEPINDQAKSNSSSLTLSGRSPPRGRERSRSPTPPRSRDIHARGSHRPERGHGGKANSREIDTLNLPQDSDRHWTPTSSSRDRSYHPPPMNADHLVDANDTGRPSLHRANSGRNHHGRDHISPSDHPIPSAMNHSPPPHMNRSNLSQGPHDSHFDRREPYDGRRHSPPEQDLHALSNRPDRPPTTRFDRRGPTSTLPPAGSNGLPMKPQDHNPLPNKGPQSDRRTDRDRYEESYTCEPYPVQSTDSRDNGRVWVPGPGGDRDRTPNNPEQLHAAPSRKRLPLPPQDAEYRGQGKQTFQENGNRRFRDRSPPPHVEELERERNDYRSYPPRDELRDDGRDQISAGPRAPLSQYDIDDREPDSARSRGRGRNDRERVANPDRSYDGLVEQSSSFDGYRERDPPSQPRAMQTNNNSSSYAHPSPAGSGPPSSRFQDRSPPPHLVVLEKRNSDGRPGTSQSQNWTERQEKSFTSGSERPNPREPRGTRAPSSSVNSIPIGNRRPLPGEIIPKDIVSNPPVERYERQAPYPQSSNNNSNNNRPNRNFEHDTRPYSEESSQNARVGYERPPHPEGAYLPPRPDERSFSGRDKPDGSRNLPPPLPLSQSDNSLRNRSDRFSSRSSRFDNDSISSIPTSKTWSGGNGNEYEKTSPRGRYSNEASTREATPPPLSREPSYGPLSAQHELPPPPPPQPPRGVQDYRVLPMSARNAPNSNSKPKMKDTRMDIDLSLPPNPMSASYSGDRYRRNDNSGPPPRGGNRRGGEISDELLKGRLNGDHQGSLSVLPPRIADSPIDDRERERPPPRMLNERLSDNGGGRRNKGGTYQNNNNNNAYNNGLGSGSGQRGERERDEFMNPPSNLPNSLPPIPTIATTTKSFKQRIDLPERPPPLPRTGSLLDRISIPPPQLQGDNNPGYGHGVDNSMTMPTSPMIATTPSLRDRVQIPAKRDRNEVIRDNHFSMDGSLVDVGPGGGGGEDNEVDASGSRRGRKRRRHQRRGGPP